MTGRVIQGYFIGGAVRPQPAQRAAAAEARPRHPTGAPPPAFAGRAAPLQARMAPGRPPLAHQGAGPVAQPHGGNGSFAIDSVQLGLARGGGQPLPQAVLAKMEAAFGADFSAVRVHLGPQAARIGAIAFTTGNDLYFAPGQFQPESVKGQQLIGHELAHVVQQRQGRVRTSGAGVTIVRDQALETEADRLGMRAAMHRGTLQPKAASSHARDIGPPRRLLQRAEQVHQGKGRRGDLEKEGANLKTAIKLELPGSGDPVWRRLPTKEKKEKGDLLEPSNQGLSAWKRMGRDGVPILTIGGPLALGGLSDTGENSTANNIILAVKHLTAHITAMEDLYPYGKIYIFIKSHSRNAVACTHILARLRKDHPQSDLVIETVFNDPVPGPQQPLDYKTGNIERSSQSTLVYSMNDGYPTGFVPQEVHGAQRLIISTKDHGVGMERGMQYNGSLYKGSRLNSLPADKLYIGSKCSPDSPEIIVECNSAATVEALLKSSDLRVSKGRHEKIMKVVKKFLGDSDTQDSPSSTSVYNNNNNNNNGGGSGGGNNNDNSIISFGSFMNTDGFNDSSSSQGTGLRQRSSGKK